MKIQDIEINGKPTPAIKIGSESVMGGILLPEGYSGIVMYNEVPESETPKAIPLKDVESDVFAIVHQDEYSSAVFIEKVA